jgi:hypothetical protein
MVTRRPVGWWDICSMCMRTFALGPTRRGQAAKNLPGWKRTLERAAGTVGTLRRGVTLGVAVSEGCFARAVEDRQS